MLCHSSLLRLLDCLSVINESFGPRDWGPGCRAVPAALGWVTELEMLSNERTLADVNRSPNLGSHLSAAAASRHHKRERRPGGALPGAAGQARSQTRPAAAPAAAARGGQLARQGAVQLGSCCSRSIAQPEWPVPSRPRVEGVAIAVATRPGPAPAGRLSNFLSRAARGSDFAGRP